MMKNMKYSCSHDKMLTFFKALCDNNRHKILHLIRKNGEMNATEIINKLELSQPAIAHHLKILVESGVLSSRKDGKETYYQIDGKMISGCCNGFAGFFGKPQSN